MVCRSHFCRCTHNEESRSITWPSQPLCAFSWGQEVGTRVPNLPWDWGTGGLATTSVRRGANGARPHRQYQLLQRNRALRLTTEARLFMLSRGERRRSFLLWLLSYSVAAPCTWRSETSTLGLGGDFSAQRGGRLHMGLVLMSEERACGGEQTLMGPAAERRQRFFTDGGSA